jgi:hypothetical protein
MNTYDEAIQTIMIAELIKCQSRNTDYNKRKLCSKMRLCQECYDRQKKTDEEIDELCMKEHEMLSLERKTYSDHENERRGKPIESCTSELDRYMISLPDRSYMLEKELGFNVLDEY